MGIHDTKPPCPNCGMHSSTPKVEAYWDVVERFERLAKDVVSDKALIAAALIRLSKIDLTLTDASKPFGIAKTNDETQVHIARNLLNEASKIIQARHNNAD